MAAGNDPGIEGILHRAQVVIQHLRTGHFHFLENVVVGAGNQDARFLDAQILHQLEIFLAGTNPAGNFREFQIQLHALFQRLAVLLAVNEKFRLADDAIGAAQLAQELIDIHHLINGVWFNRLLPIPEGGIGNPDFFRHIQGNTAVVEGYLGHRAVGINIPLQIRFRHILQGIPIGIFFQEVGFTGNFQHLYDLLLRMFYCIQLYLCFMKSQVYFSGAQTSGGSTTLAQS